MDPNQSAKVHQQENESFIRPFNSFLFYQQELVKKVPGEMVEQGRLMYPYM
jgi:hypothetical protein